MKTFNRLREETLEEKLKSSDPTGKWISDFVHSDNPKFAGKSKKERIRMALGASYAAKRQNEDNNHIVEVNHRIGLTVTDPNHPMVSKRKETIQKTVRVSGEDRENAIKRAIAHYRRKGYKVHDHHYIGTVNEEVDQTNEEIQELDRSSGTVKKTITPVKDLDRAKDYEDAQKIISTDKVRRQEITGKELPPLENRSKKSPRVNERVTMGPDGKPLPTKFSGDTPAPRSSEEEKAHQEAKKDIEDTLKARDAEIEKKNSEMRKQGQTRGNNLGESAWGKDKMANLKAAHDRHSEKAIAANKSGNDEAVKVHQSKMNMLKNQMNKLRKEEVDLAEADSFMDKVKSVGKEIRRTIDRATLPAAMKVDYDRMEAEKDKAEKDKEEMKKLRKEEVGQIRGIGRIVNKMTKESIERINFHESVVKKHEELRKKRGAPHPDYYKELSKSYDINDDKERLSKQSEIKKKYKVQEGSIEEGEENAAKNKNKKSVKEDSDTTMQSKSTSNQGKDNKLPTVRQIMQADKKEVESQFSDPSKESPHNKNTRASNSGSKVVNKLEDF